ncbi:hypothetical protein C8J56DRAFT_299600 [Mycena floridula]|nr:hypothetical protein C8J56DRAFT_299600 [Mycena floridula]
MSIKKISRTNLTLFVFLLAIGLVNASSHHVAGGISRRDHSSLKRLVKKRATADSPTDSTGTDTAGSNKAAGALVVGGVTLLPGSGSSTSATGTSTGTSTATSASESATSLSSASATSATSASVSASDSLSASASATSASVSATELSKAAPTTTASPTTDAAQPSDVNPGTTTLIHTVSQSAGDSEETQVSPPTTNALGTKGKTALITVLIVVASCVGGIAIFWTVFRKWKLGRSSKFDQRLQPIDWQPTHDDDDMISHRLASDNASLRSGRGYGATSDHGHASDNGHRGFDPLDHDFTAGSNNLAPVGGYADLARGSSPQPPMQESMNYGPSITRPNYDVGVPLHHQTNYGAHEAYNSGRY